MRFSKRTGSSSGLQTYALFPEDAGDVWTIFNLVEPGDELRGAALRKVVREGFGESSGGGDAMRVHTRLTLLVQSVSFDAEAGVLRAAGRVCSENAHARLGSHHTLDVWPRAPGGLELSKEIWDSVSLRRLHDAADVGRRAEVAAVLLDGTGRAAVCLVTDRLTLVRAKIDVAIPRKRAGDSAAASLGSSSSSSSSTSNRSGNGIEARSRWQARFFEAVLNATLRHIDWPAVKAVIVASPGFVKDDWLRWALTRPDARPLADARVKILLGHCVSGHSRALSAVLADAATADRLAGTRAAGDAAALAAFFEALRADNARAFYGFRHVRFAADRAAVARLLLSDALFRHSPPDVRRDYVALADDVAAAAGEVIILSSMHGAGAQLSQMAGVAAITRYPLSDAEEASSTYAARAVAHARAGRLAAAAASAQLPVARSLDDISGCTDDREGDDAAGSAAGGDSRRFLGAAAFSAGLFDSEDSSDSDV